MEAGDVILPHWLLRWLEQDFGAYFYRDHWSSWRGDNVESERSRHTRLEARLGMGQRVGIWFSATPSVVDAHQAENVCRVTTRTVALSLAP